MVFVSPLPPERLYREADSTALSFTTTADLTPIDGLVGQGRARDAMRLGTRINRDGFNLFVMGPPGARMRESVSEMLAEIAPSRPAPSDWVYVNNFSEPHKPIAIELPPGRAPAVRDAMRDLIEDLKTALPTAFESEEYQTRRSAIDEAFQRKQAESFTALRDKAAPKSVAILRTPLGFALAPMRNGEVVRPEEFNSWSEAEKRAVQEAISELEKDLEHIMRQIPQWEKERRDEVRLLNRDTAQFAVGQSIEEAKAHLSDLPRVIVHLDAVYKDLVDSVGMFVAKQDEGAEEQAMRAGGVFDRYEVNVLVTRTEAGAPVVEELHPTLANLIGRIEYAARQGFLFTNFRLIKAGAFHRANGGYLLLDVRSLLLEPFSWTALKRTLRQRKIVIEDMSRFMGATSTLSLDPDPIPVDLKVVLFGDRILFYLLAAFDPELREHFKVLADFEDDIERTEESEMLIARVIASVVQREELKPVDRAGVARMIEHAARLADHGSKLSLLADQLRDIVAEADHWAMEEGAAVTGRRHVEQAIEQGIHRAARLRDRAQEAILQQVALIDTAGAKPGQVNGLSVIQLGGFSFGRPSRITCRVRPGSGRVVDIEREVELGGPIHSKGVLILAGFIAGRYALDAPMSLYASLVFEQSYGGIEGDSASSAELYALLSALAEVPLRQDLAVTGSVNQHGEVQAIGGVNEKVEGFFDICRARGLTGTQGVLIPAANVQHLMLRRDVIEACVAGRFAVYPVSSVEEGIALLTGRNAGERGSDGRYPESSINRLVEDRLRAFAEARRSFVRDVTDAASGKET